CYSRCRAFVFPAIEDFGIVMVEAQAYGKPVIACAGGGAAEIVIDGETGVLFLDQTPEALIAAIRELENLRVDKERIREHAMEFDEGVFREKIRKFVEENC
ncbi:MAG: glycosyltransferase, partial [Terriglobia bacterium]